MEGRAGLPPGTVLDRSYRIVRMLGAGGFGITYEAEDIELRAKVAIKEYFPAEFGDRDETMSVRPRTDSHRPTFEWGRSSFLEEAQTLVRFKHASIVRVTRFFRANATAYMVMDFEEGPSFEAWLQRLGRAPVQRELDLIVAPLLGAIEVIHAANFLHRDIAPDNIIIRASGTPVLLDFGAARQAVAQRSRALTGIVKAGYSPLEQYATEGRLQGPWSDIYAIGATLYRAVAGRPPEEATVRMVDDQTPPATLAALGEYRSGFLAAIDACLNPDRTKRPQSVPQLRPILLSSGRVAETRILAPQALGGDPSATAGGRGLWLAIAAAAVLLGGAYAAFVQFPTANEGREPAAGVPTQEAAERRASEGGSENAEKEEGALWGYIEHSNSIRSFEDFIRRYPTSTRVAIAEKRIAELKSPEGVTNAAPKPDATRPRTDDDVVWAYVEHANSISALEDFIKRYPTSRHVEMAQRRIGELKGR